METKNSKNQRIAVRATARQENLIRRAAEATDRSMTDFILESASMEAERVLADRRWFMLNETQWAEFNRLLDAPMSSTSKLDALASRPSPFSGPDN